MRILSDSIFVQRFVMCHLILRAISFSIWIFSLRLWTKTIKIWYLFFVLHVKDKRCLKEKLTRRRTHAHTANTGP